MNPYNESQAVPMRTIAGAVKSPEELLTNTYLPAAKKLHDATGISIDDCLDAVLGGYLHPITPEAFAPILLEHLTSGPEGLTPYLRFFDMKAFAEHCLAAGLIVAGEYRGKACTVEPGSA